MDSGAPEDYFPLCGLHHGFMPELARITELNLVLVCQWWAAQADYPDGKLRPTTKADRLTFIQQGIELIRPTFNLESLAQGLSPSAEQKDAASGEEAGGSPEEDLQPFGNFLNEIVLISSQPKLDVLFELMEWNLAGPQLPTAFGLLWTGLLPKQYAAWLKEADGNATPGASDQADLLAKLGTAAPNGQPDSALEQTFQGLCRELSG